MNLAWESAPAADVILDRDRPGSDVRPAWFTTIATALLWGAFLGALPAFLLVFTVIGAVLIPMVAMAGASVGFAAAAGASLLVVLGRRSIGRPAAGYAVAASGGFLGCVALAAVMNTVYPSVMPLPPFAQLGIAVVAGLVAGAFLPDFSRRLAAPSSPVVGTAVLATLLAMVGSAVVCVLMAQSMLLEGIAFTEAAFVCRDTDTLGPFVRRDVAYFPAQATCVYRDGSVETIPRSEPMLMALVAGIALAVLATGWLIFAVVRRSRVLTTPALAMVAASCSALLLVFALGSSLYGAFGPVATALGP